MTDINFTDGVRDDTSIIIGIAGASGSGKTVSGLLLAEGLAGDDGDIAFIDTEGGRARHYFPTPNDTRSRAELRKDFLFRVKYFDMRPPFTPRAIWAAIDEAIEKVRAKVVVVDSASDEWEGVGGLHDMHIDEMARLAKKPFDAMQEWEMNKFNFPAWAVPKAQHKTHLMKNLRQVRAHVIFCFRAKELTKPVEVVDDNGRKRTTVQKIGWTPICEQNMLYDLTISFMVTPDAPGVPLMMNGKFYGKLNPPYSQFFQPGQRVSLQTGEQLRAWARGDTKIERSPVPQAARPDAGRHAPSQDPESNPFLTDYSNSLAGEIERGDLEDKHAHWRAGFADKPEAVKRAGREILNIHTMRVEGQINAEEAERQVEQTIARIAA